MPVEVWGTGRDGEAVTVEILGKSAAAKVESGRWSVTLPPLPATESTTLTLRGDKTVELKDVAIGEVWIASGQSNMEWRLNQCSPHSDALLASADIPGIRQIKVPLRPYAGDPLPALAWKPFDKASAGFFSAVAFYFADGLHRKLGVPVGIVNCAFGGTPIEAWMSRAAIARSGGAALLADDEKKAAAYPDPAVYEKAYADYSAAKKAWDDKKKAGASDAELGPQPAEPYGFRTKGRPAGLYDSMLGVIRPYTARGVLWYQGENNAGRPADYEALLRGLAAEFRSDWKQPEWPFLIGQISSPTANWPDDQDAFARIREAQRAVATGDPHSGLVVTLDYGERGNVHPIQKQPVGERFARLALAKVYGIPGGAAQSPTASSATAGKDGVTITFDNLPGHLEMKDPTLPTLEVQSASGTWKPATATISPDGRRLVVAVAADDQPRAVRYAWRNFCTLTLFTDEGLPVSPFTLTLSK